MRPLLDVVVRKREGTLYEGKATSVSSWNEVGTFDVLPLHANFVSVIKKTLTVRKDSGRDLEVPIDRGILHVKENKVDVFLGI